MSKCLVTGHKGYIGSEVFKALKDMGHEVIGIDLKDGNDILEKLKPFADGTFHPHWTKFKRPRKSIWRLKIHARKYVRRMV